MIDALPVRAALVAAGATTVVAAAGALLTRLDSWYYGLRKPSWQPPDWAFGPAWTVVFTCAAWSGVLGWLAPVEPAVKARMLGLLAANGVLNVAWSLLFFRLRRPDWALMEVGCLWLSILVLVWTQSAIVPRAGWLMLPYLAWVSFASVLNLAIVRLNRPFPNP